MNDLLKRIDEKIDEMTTKAGSGRFKTGVKTKDDAKKIIKKRTGAKSIVVKAKGQKIWIFADGKKAGIWDSESLKLTYGG